MGREKEIQDSKITRFLSYKKCISFVNLTIDNNIGTAFHLPKRMHCRERTGGGEVW